MSRALFLIDRLSLVLARIALAEVVALVLATGFGVVFRLALDRPGAWAIDVSVMLNGTMFMLAAGYTFQQQAHVRVDAISARLPPRVQHLVNCLFLLVLFVPCIGWLGWTALAEAIAADAGDAPGLPAWPLHAGIALGLLGLMLQSLAQAARHLAVLRRGRRA